MTRHNSETIVYVKLQTIWMVVFALLYVDKQTERPDDDYRCCLVTNTPKNVNKHLIGHHLFSIYVGRNMGQV